MAKTNFKTVDEYIKSQPTDTKKTLQALRKIIFKAAPDAVELFNYDIAAYALVKGGKRDKQIMIAGLQNLCWLLHRHKYFGTLFSPTIVLQNRQSIRAVSQQSTVA